MKPTPPQILVVDDQYATNEFERRNFLRATHLDEAESGDGQAHPGATDVLGLATFCSGQRRDEGWTANDYEVVRSAIGDGTSSGGSWALILLDVRFDSHPDPACEEPLVRDENFGEFVRERLSQETDLPILLLSSKPQAELENQRAPYLSKIGISEHELRLALLRHARLSKEQRRWLLRIDPGIIADGDAILQLFLDAFTHAASAAPILILGETGVGKEVLTSYIHRVSGRADQPLVALNVSTLPGDLVEAELFGIEHGVATGTVERPGAFEVANGGTLVLDEVGDMPLAAQPKLFRALQEQKIRRIGGREEIEINVRLIAATSRNLPSMIKEGTFRSELYYRLRGVELRVPSLRERADEIVPLAKGFIERFSADYGKQGISLSNDAAEELRRWSFPGNIRELKALVERVVVATGNNRVIHAEQLRELLTTNQEEGIPVAAKTAPLVPAASDCADEDNAQPSTEPVSLASLEQFLDDVRIGTDDPLVRGAKPRLEAALNRILRRLAGAALIRSGYAVSGERQKGMQLLTGDSELKGQGPKRIVNQLLGRRLDEPVTDEDLAKLVAAWKEGKR